MIHPQTAFHGCSDTGRVRRVNEDSYALLPAAGIAVLADGMGGHASGELASAAAVSGVLRLLTERGAEQPSSDDRLLYWLEDAVATANREIIDRAGDRSAHTGMGTTLLITLFHGRRLAVAHVGDCRLYRLRQECLEQLTRDHTVGELLAESGHVGSEDPLIAQQRNMLTRAVGVEPAPRPDLVECEWLPGDLFLLCSDGLYNMVDDDHIRLTLVKFDANLGAMARELVQMANDNGGLDNISVVLAQPAATEPEPA